jgi:hypothetical protein
VDAGYHVRQAKSAFDGLQRGGGSGGRAPRLTAFFLTQCLKVGRVVKLNKIADGMDRSEESFNISTNASISTFLM